jgi:iron complex outermembrane receptor protein
VRYDGCTIEAAPGRLANVLLTWSPRFLRGGRIAGEWTHTGKYWMDAENLHEYAGHDLMNLNASFVLSLRAELFARVFNATDRNYAEVAAFAQNSFQYNPGTPRTAYAGVRLGWQR